ncbi:hypothetical protein ACFQY7_13505 [Actinomadura luteofluorescens]|uniref:hypothetical protein n=1 Tax=Actinomadura luteofluorescens TaxID=46163 RepID=UPI0036267AD1
MDGAAQLGAVGDPDDDRPAGQRAEVDADDAGGLVDVSAHNSLIAEVRGHRSVRCAGLAGRWT